MPGLKTIFLLLLLPLMLSVSAQQSLNKKILSPLTSFSKEWDKDVYLKCNTAAQDPNMTNLEKDIIWILNLVRLDPDLFLKSVILNPNSEYYVKPASRSDYHRSLIDELKKSKPIKTLLKPTQYLFEKASCHAFHAGQAGYVGHDRKWPAGCEPGFFAECCSYGYEDPLDIVMQLLIDEGVPSLGHRQICLSPVYDKIGVAIRPHTAYAFNAVLDLQ